MIHVYNEQYLYDVMENLGIMLHYGVYDLNFSPTEFCSLFISSGIAKEIENANPKFLVGMSGVELAREVIYRSFRKWETTKATICLDKSPEYWAAWILVYFQFETRLSFKKIFEAISIDELLNLYKTLHEADIKKAAQVLNEKYDNYILNSITKLAKFRKMRGFTQAQLAEISGVKLRMIQLYEQRENDIAKAGVNTLISLSTALQCEILDLVD